MKKSIDILARFEPEIKPEGQFQHLETARSQQWEEFERLYRDRRLTDCLETLEQQGFSGDSAIFILTLAGGEA